MKELRELYDNGTQGEWCSLHHYNDVFVAENTTVCTTQNGDDADLIAAMHNALPELLDAWETVQALEWATNEPGWMGYCIGDMLTYGREKVVAAYRERGNK